MMPGVLKIRLEGGVATVVFDRPPVNALDIAATAASAVERLARPSGPIRAPQLR
jgi:hypothetical protein